MWTFKSRMKESWPSYSSSSLVLFEIFEWYFPSLLLHSDVHMVVIICVNYERKRSKRKSSWVKQKKKMFCMMREDRWFGKLICGHRTSSCYTWSEGWAFLEVIEEIIAESFVQLLPPTAKVSIFHKPWIESHYWYLVEVLGYTSSRVNWFRTEGHSINIFTSKIENRFFSHHCKHFLTYI